MIRTCRLKSAELDGLFPEIRRLALDTALWRGGFLVRWPKAWLLPVFLVVVVLAACGRTSPSPTEKVWASDGYGLIYQLRDNQLRIYQTTSVSCLLAETLEPVGPADPDGPRRFGHRDIAVQSIRPDADGRATLHVEGTAANVDLVPLDALPARCSVPTSNDPFTNFDILWAGYAENYNSTVRKHVDWAALRDQYRPRVTAFTSEEELFTIVCPMIESLHDHHARIYGPYDQVCSGWRPGTPDLHGQSEGRVQRDFIRAVDAHAQDIAVGPVQSFADGKIAYADLPHDIGYLRITAFENYGGPGPFRNYGDNDSSYPAGREILARALDAIFTAQRVGSLHRLIIDLRDNDGGADALGIQIAARLTDKPYLAYRKQQRIDPHDPTRFGRLQDVTVTPADAPRYTGPIELLTNELTLSAGETFIEALMQRIPAPVRIGATTQGIFADDMIRRLPNGWTYTDGNEDYIAADGVNYEGPGIPPTSDIRLTGVDIPIS